MGFPAHGCSASRRALPMMMGHVQQNVHALSPDRRKATTEFTIDPIRMSAAVASKAAVRLALLSSRVHLCSRPFCRLQAIHTSNLFSKPSRGAALSARRIPGRANVATVVSSHLLSDGGPKGAWPNKTWLRYTELQIQGTAYSSCWCTGRNQHSCTQRHLCRLQQLRHQP